MAWWCWNQAFVADSLPNHRKLSNSSLIVHTESFCITARYAGFHGEWRVTRWKGREILTWNCAKKLYVTSEKGERCFIFQKAAKKRNTDYSIQCWKLKAKEVHKFQAPAIQGEMLNLKLFSKLYFVRVRECLETLNKKLCMNVSGSFYSGLTWRFVMNFVAERWKLFWKLLDMLLIVQAECTRRVIRVISGRKLCPALKFWKQTFHRSLHELCSKSPIIWTLFFCCT